MPMLNVRSHFFAATLSAVSMFFPLPVIYNCNFDRFHLAISGQNRMNWKTDCFPFVSNVYTQLEMHVQWLLPVLFPIFSFSLSLPPPIFIFHRYYLCSILWRVTQNTHCIQKYCVCNGTSTEFQMKMMKRPQPWSSGRTNKVKKNLF